MEDLSYIDSSSPTLRQSLADFLRSMGKKEDYQQIGQAIQNTSQLMPSVLESLGRGAIAQVPGTVGDVSQTLRDYFPQTMQSAFNKRKALTTEEILQAVPRINPDYQGSQQHEMVGGLIAPALGKMLKMGAEATKGMKGGLSIEDVSREYRGSHQPPHPESDMAGFFHELDKIMPKDVYTVNGKNWYGSGDKAVDSEWWKPMMQARKNPNFMVEIHRAVPKGVKEINSGDWVTPSKTYANWHGENVLNGDYDIISKKVPAGSLTSEGYPYELGFWDKLPTVERKSIIENELNKL
jgi:hypothetical protein